MSMHLTFETFTEDWQGTPQLGSACAITQNDCGNVTTWTTLSPEAQIPGLLITATPLHKGMSYDVEVLPSFKGRVKFYLNEQDVHDPHRALLCIKQ